LEGFRVALKSLALMLIAAAMFMRTVSITTAAALP